MANKSISIVGCGWLGLPLATYLAKNGWRVNGSTTTEDKLPTLSDRGIQPFLLSASNQFDDIEALFDVDVLFLNIPPRNDRTNHLEQMQALQQQAKGGAIKWVILVSSTGIYPNANREVSETDADPNAKSRGGVNFWEVEQIWRQHPSWQSTILRFGGLYGPGRDPNRFLQDKTAIPGGLNPVNMIHLEDCIGVVASLLRNGPIDDTYNVCSPKKLTRKAFYERAAQSRHLPPPSFIENKTNWKLVSVSKLLTASGYEFQH